MKLLQLLTVTIFILPGFLYSAEKKEGVEKDADFEMVPVKINGKLIYKKVKNFLFFCYR